MKLIWFLLRIVFCIIVQFIQKKVSWKWRNMDFRCCLFKMNPSNHSCQISLVKSPVNVWIILLFNYKASSCERAWDWDLISTILVSKEWLEAGKLQRVVLVIMSKATGEVLERWNFRIETDKQVVEEGWVLSQFFFLILVFTIFILCYESFQCFEGEEWQGDHEGDSSYYETGCFQYNLLALSWWNM